MVVGLSLNAEGGLTAHEVFEGNRVDSTTMGDMLQTLEHRTGGQKGQLVVVDRGLATKENLEAIKNAQHDYIVASKQPERDKHLADFEDDGGWEEMQRDVSVTNRHQKKSHVVIKRRETKEEIHVLCVSDGRAAKDKAIREGHEKKLLEDLEKLAKRIASCPESLLRTRKSTKASAD